MEIIRYQVLIPVSEVQVKAGTISDSDGHYMWELIQLKTSGNRRREKSYHLSNRYFVLFKITQRYIIYYAFVH